VEFRNESPHLPEVVAERNKSCSPQTGKSLKDLLRECIHFQPQCTLPEPHFSIASNKNTNKYVK